MHKRDILNHESFVARVEDFGEHAVVFNPVSAVLAFDRVQELGHSDVSICFNIADEIDGLLIAAGYLLSCQPRLELGPVFVVRLGSFTKRAGLHVDI